ncbi:MAG TPA: hypothetical protein VF052_09320, partial [Solirubrobacterales bacterium]
MTSYSRRRSISSRAPDPSGPFVELSERVLAQPAADPALLLAGPNLDEAAADESAEEIRAAIGDHPDDFESQLSEEELATLASFVAGNAGN